MNYLCVQNVELLNVKHGGTYSDHWALKGYMSVTKSRQLKLYSEIIAVSFNIYAKEISELWLGFTICECSN